MQKTLVALALCAPAAAFVGNAPAAASVVAKESLADLKQLQKDLPGPPGDYFDPLALGSMTRASGAKSRASVERRPQTGRRPTSA